MNVKQLATVLEGEIVRGTELEEAVGDLEKFLDARGAGQLLPSVLKVLLRKFKAHVGTELCRIETAFETNDELLKEIAKTLGATEYSSTTNTELIGGFTALYSHQLVDASTRRHVEALKTQLS